MKFLKVNKLATSFKLPLWGTCISLIMSGAQAVDQVSTLDKPFADAVAVRGGNIDEALLVAMPFRTDSQEYTLDSATLELRSDPANSPTETLLVRLWLGDGNGVPTGAHILEFTDAQPTSTTVPERVTVTPTVPFTLQPDTEYVLGVVETNNPFWYWSMTEGTEGFDTPSGWDMPEVIPVSYGFGWFIDPFFEDFLGGRRLKGAIGATPTSPPVVEFSRIENKFNGRWLQALDGGSAWNVRTRETTATGDRTRWKSIDLDGTYVRLENKQETRWLQALEAADAWNVRTRETTATGDRTKWRFIDAGAGYSRIENKFNGRWLQALEAADAWNVRTRETTATGDRTRWRFIDAGN